MIMDASYTRRSIRRHLDRPMLPDRIELQLNCVRVPSHLTNARRGASWS